MIKIPEEKLRIKTAKWKREDGRNGRLAKMAKRKSEHGQNGTTKKETAETFKTPILIKHISYAYETRTRTNFKRSK